MTYQWRVRTVCASGNPSDLVPGTNFTTLCAAPGSLNSNNVTHTSAQLTWLTVNAGVSYEIRYRPQGTVAWSSQTVASPSSNPDVTTNLFLTGLVPQTTYEWQVRTICSGFTPTYSTSAFFTTACPVPTGLSSTSVLAYSAQLSWSPGTTGIATDLQFQLQGSTTWTTIPGITANTFSLTGLNVGAAYRWQVRGACTPTVSSSYANPVSFTTSCLQPGNLASTSIATNAAQLNWSNVNTGATFTLQWRPQSTPNWTTVSGLLGTAFSLTGLTAGTGYVWQVSAACTPTISSSYAGPVSFNTATVCTNMYSLRNGSWDDPMVWSCGRVPNSTDIVRVRHLISVPPNYNATALQVFFDTVPKVALGQNAQLNLGQ
ncbi:MAG: hypothetical protein EAZ91_21080 [Cytophagales bacterium]|nr:MAG: hypothetical protein EAZ91_21080 [Cytophagales bacterium]